MKTSLYINNCRRRGQGVFSGRTFKPGQFILQFTGALVATRDIADFTHYIQITPDYFLGPSGGADDYVNHSCNPNSAVYREDGNLVLRALKNIRRNDEIVFDYGTIIFSEPTTFQCHCGSRRCRGTIGNFYALAADLQDYYLSGNMVPMLCGYYAVDPPAGMAVGNIA